MTDYHVFSRHTDIIIGQREAWYEQLKGERLEWEDLAAAESTNELLRMLDPVPLYQYIVNYLLYLWEDEFSEEAMCEQVISDLIDRVASAFEKNGMPEEKCAKAYIRDMLTTEWSREWDSFEKAASRRIFELGLGLGLPAEDVEQLLKKAVKRAGFNYYDPEELLVYCALRFCHRNHFVCFQALKRDFKSIHPAGSAKEKFYFGSTAEIVDKQKTELTIGDAVDKDCQNRETVNVDGKVYVVTDTSMKLSANEGDAKFTKVLHSSSTTVSYSEKYTIANCSVLKPFSECQGTFKGFFAAADYYRDGDGLIFPADYTYNQYIEFKNMQGLKERLDNNLITNMKGND